MDPRETYLRDKLARPLRLSVEATRKLLTLAPRLEDESSARVIQGIAQVLAQIDATDLGNKSAWMDKALRLALSERELLMLTLYRIAKQIRLDRETREVLVDAIRRGEIKTEAQLLKAFGGDLRRAKASLAAKSDGVQNNGSAPGAGGAGSIEAIHRVRDFFWVEIDRSGQEVSARTSQCDDVDRFGKVFNTTLERKGSTFIQVNRADGSWWPVAGWLCGRREQLRQLQGRLRFT